MGSSEKYNLTWKGFNSNIQNTFQSIRYEENLSDVTLICEDEFINAHKFVLGASSDFFQNIFRKCQKTNPLIIHHTPGHFIERERDKCECEKVQNEESLHFS